MNEDLTTPSDSAPLAPPEAPEPSPPPVVKGPRRRRRALLVVAVGLAALGVAGALGYEPLLRYLVQRETRRLGFVVSYDTITVHRFLSNAVLRGVHVDLDGVRGLHTDLDEVSVDLDRLKA